MVLRNRVAGALIALFFIVGGSSAFAGSEAIRGGAWQVGGSVAGGYDSANGLNIDVYPSARYLVTDRFAVGALLRFHHTEALTRTGAGPSAEYYFWKSGKWASYVGQNIIFSKTKYASGQSYSDSAATTSLGTSYFFARHTALGLSLDFTYFARDTGETSRMSAIRGNFRFFF